jgi:predicted AlkP superfamily phosphohydrolase/phosphomutase
MKAEKILVIGWDGATFDLIDPLIKAGRMPNIAKLMERGMSGPLASTIPAVTPVAWTTYMTGVNPGKHGIFDAFVLDRKASAMRFVSASRRRVKPVWSILSDRGRAASAVNVPVTYPPDKVSGVCISGMFTPPAAEDFMHPAGLQDELAARFGRYLDSPAMYPDPERYLESLLSGVDWRADLTIHLMERAPWEFFCSVFMESDRVQHFFWEYRDPAHPLHARLHDAIEQVYVRLDAALGRILVHAGENAAVAMLSDHGAGPLNTAVFLNKWLIDEGYLTVKADLQELFTPRKSSALRRLAGKAARAVLPKSLRKARVKKKIEHINRMNDLFCQVVDWERSTAMSDGVSGGIFLNTDGLDAAGRAKLVAELKEKLLALTDPATGQKPFEAVYEREEIYFGEAVSDAPDLITVCSPGYGVIVPHEFLLYSQEYLDSVFVKHKWSGRHEKYGIFLLAGPGAKAGAKLTNMAMADVTPTLLYFLDEDIPDYMDGHVAVEGVEPETLRERPPKASAADMASNGAGEAYSEEDELEMAEGLKDLGYM